MRICVDLDGVVCRLKQPGEQYADLLPVPGAVEKLRQLKAAGHYLILCTARHMKTCEGNVGRVVALQGATTLNWLARHGIEYDEIHFGKPHADVYLDDNAMRFESWDGIPGDGSTLPLSAEKHLQRASKEKTKLRFRVMNIVMPMAGRGSRFTDAGIKLPKPLIPVRGEPMYAWAMRSLPLSLARRTIFVCLADHLRSTGLEEDIRRRFATLDPVIVSIDEVTQGQACTVLLARKYIDNDDSLLIYNADTYCRTRLSQTLPQLSKSVDGLFGAFRAPGDKWSFARADHDGRVEETAEKRRISDWVSTGLYRFRRGADFVHHTQAMIDADERHSGEFYVAPVYNRLIAAGADIRLDVADEVWPLGTPEDLTMFERCYRDPLSTAPG